MQHVSEANGKNQLFLPHAANQRIYASKYDNLKLSDDMKEVYEDIQIHYFMGAFYITTNHASC